MGRQINHTSCHVLIWLFNYKDVTHINLLFYSAFRIILCWKADALL